MPNPSEDRPTPPPSPTEEALRRLEQRLDRASEAAERLMAEAAAAAAGAGNPDHHSTPTGEPPASGPPAGEPPAGEPFTDQGSEPATPPPSGWQIPEDPPAGTVPDLEPFLAFAQALRDLIPPELQRRLVAALRELLLALRALIDWYLERLERRREQSVEVQDIPIL